MVDEGGHSDAADGVAEFDPLGGLEGPGDAHAASAHGVDEGLDLSSPRDRNRVPARRLRGGGRGRRNFRRKYLGRDGTGGDGGSVTVTASRRVYMTVYI